VSLPSALQMRDLSLRVARAVPTEYYLEPREIIRNSGSRWTVKGVTVDCFRPSHQITMIEFYSRARGWLYRVSVGNDGIICDTFMGDKGRCVEDYTMLNLAL
jgi:hypothetical protein